VQTLADPLGLGELEGWKDWIGTIAGAIGDILGKRGGRSGGGGQQPIGQQQAQLYIRCEAERVSGVRSVDCCTFRPDLYACPGALTQTGPGTYSGGVTVTGQVTPDPGLCRSNPQLCRYLPWIVVGFVVLLLVSMLKGRR